MDVVYSGNRAIFKGILLSVLSALKYTKRSLTVHILTADLTNINPKFLPITSADVEPMKAVLEENDPKGRVVIHDLSEVFMQAFANGKNNTSGYTPYALLRLLLDNETSLEKVVYLDADTMIVGDIAELYDVDVENYEFAGVVDYMGEYWMGTEYINSGVLVLNMNNIRESGLFDKARAMVNSRKMIMPDQNALNKYVKRKLILPRRFNEQRGIKPDTVVKHFNKGIKWLPFFHLYNYKQWQRDKVHKKLKIFCFDDVYKIYDDLCVRFNLDENALQKSGNSTPII